MIGEDYELSILAPHWAWEAGAAVFELWDGERSLTYWVREIPTPRQAATLLTEHGGPPEEERGKPRELDPVGGEGGRPDQRREQDSGSQRLHENGTRRSTGWLVQQLSEEFGVRVDEQAKAVRTLGHTSFPHRTPPPGPVRLRHDRSETLAKKFLPD